MFEGYLDYRGRCVVDDIVILLVMAKDQEMCKKVGIANGLHMLKLAVIDEFVDQVQRKQVDQKPSREPQPKNGAVQVGVESASESEWPQKQKKPDKKTWQ